MKPKFLGIVVLFIFLICATTAAPYTLSFEPKIDVREVYTDNLFLDEDDEDDDFVTEVAAGLDLEARWQTSGIELSFLPGYAFYQDNSDLDDWRLAGSLNAYAGLTRRSQLRLRSNVERTEDPLPILEITDIRRPSSLIPPDTTVRREREPYLRIASNLNYSYQFGQRDKINFGYRHAILDNDDSRRQDNQRHGPNIGLEYWLSPFWSISPRARYTRAIFDGDSSDFDEIFSTLRLTNRITRHFDWFLEYGHRWRNYDEEETVEEGRDRVGERNFQIFNPSAGITWQVAKDVPLVLEVGYYYRKVDSGNDDDGPVFSLDSGSSWEFKRGGIYVNGGSGYRLANFGAENLGFELYGETLVEANYSFTRRIRGDIRAGFRRSDFKDTRDDRKDNVFRTGAALTFQLLPWMYLRTAYLFRIFDSSEAEDYTENRGLLELIFRPERPWRSIQ